MNRKTLERISVLETRIFELENNLKKYFIPNQEFKELKNRLINIVNDMNFDYPFELDEGSTCFNFYKLIDMKETVIEHGNVYILLTGSRVDNDLALWDLKQLNPNYYDINNLLLSNNIKRLYDNRINADEAYLIALNDINQTEIPIENIAKFVRK